MCCTVYIFSPRRTAKASVQSPVGAKGSPTLMGRQVSIFYGFPRRAPIFDELLLASPHLLYFFTGFTRQAPILDLLTGIPRRAPMPTTARSSQTLKRLPAVATASAAQAHVSVRVRSGLFAEHKFNIFQVFTPVA